MRRWELFNLLKNNNYEKPIDEYVPREIEQLINKISIQELKEGVIEYLLSKMHEEGERKAKIREKIKHE